VKILILGSGGREHALAWAAKQNPKCDTLLCAPGNAGIAKIADCHDLDIEDPEAVVAFAQTQGVDFVIIGPEAPLVAGVGDRLRSNGIMTFGPDKAAAQLEASKNFTKEVCAAANAPTAAYGHFTDPAAAKQYVRDQGAPIVVKADGLAAGKGVVVAMTVAEAETAIDTMFAGEFGSAGAEVVIEEFMEGEEASLFVLCDGVTALPVGTAQDHKRAFDGDTGPNTGGMGAYSPAPILDPVTLNKAMEEIVYPTLKELNARNIPYQGVLYVGLMIKEGQPRLVEYNVRFGDPECQVLMMRLGAQAFDLIEATVRGQLAGAQVNWADDHALSIVMATKGYPGSYAKGSMINGLDHLPETSKSMCFHAGTTQTETAITATGGRVLNITARAESLRAAREAAYSVAEQVDWPEGFFRTDIGWRAL
jgi:phosphoribosylamine--glycine ligase